MSELRTAVTSVKNALTAAHSSQAETTLVSTADLALVVNAADQFERCWVEVREAAIAAPRGTPVGVVPPREDEEPAT